MISPSDRTSFWTRLVPFLLLSGAVAKALDKSLTSLDQSLESRQEEVIGDPILNAQCVYLCDVSTGCGSANVCPLNRRDLSWSSTSTSASLGYRLWNETSGDFDDLSADEYEAEIAERSILSKRGWNYNPRWVKDKIGAYLSDQARDRGPRDAQFGKMRLIVSEKENSMATVSQSAEFAKEKPFQLGSGGLHGCTVLTIVSSRAVYMAHYWEVHALNEKDSDIDEAGSQGEKKFKSRIEYTLTGEGAKDRQTEGSPVDWSLFNQQDDNTRIIIMTPYDFNYQGAPGAKTTAMSQILYPKKIQKIIDIIRDDKRIPGAAAIVQGYVRLNYSWDKKKKINVGKDAHKVDMSERGIACFQHDGEGNYRLFYEHMMYTGGDKKAG